MRKSILTIIAVACIGLNFLAPLAEQAGRVIILVRHAEKAAVPADDPPLSPAGMQRAQALADSMAEARVDAILTTHFQRTRQTAAPLAQARGLTPVVIQAGGDTPSHAREVAEAVRARPQGEIILVVGHSNTVPAIIAALGGPTIPELCTAEYATLFILILQPTGPARLIRSSYGAPDPPAAADCLRTMKQATAIAPSAQESSSAARPATIQAEPVDPKLPTLFLIGDSTARNGRGDGQWGWGAHRRLLR